MRRDAKTDVNQAQIVAALREAQRTVVLLHRVGQGVPDLLVGYQGKMVLLEVKAGAKSKFTQQQLEFRDNWRGPAIRVVTTINEALEATK